MLPILVQSHHVDESVLTMNRDMNRFCNVEKESMSSNHINKLYFRKKIHKMTWYMLMITTCIKILSLIISRLTVPFGPQMQAED